MPKTITEKIFDAHCVDEPFAGTYVLKLDRVFCHEITTPIAINDLIKRGKDRVYDASKIKAVIEFIKNGGSVAYIAKTELFEETLAGKAGTTVTRD